MAVKLGKLDALCLFFNLDFVLPQPHDGPAATGATQLLPRVPLSASPSAFPKEIPVMPLFPISLALLVVLAFLGWTMVGEAARGERWITLSRTCTDSPDEVWARIEAAWAKSALTFEPVRILPESSATEKSFTLNVEDRVFRTRLKRLANLEPFSLTLTCVEANGQTFPLGRDHRKIWQVVPYRGGSLIRIAATFKAPPSAILQAIFTFRRQLAMVAKG